MLRILSLGAGVQSSTLALMAACGQVGPMPDAAIFADTQDEPAHVYEQVRWLQTVLPYPVHVVTAGCLSDELLGGNDMARIPAHIRGGGLVRRQCTRNFKLRPIRRRVRELLGDNITAEQWIGISLDEAHRMRISDVQYIINRYPLIEERMSRSDCLRWLRREGYPEPGKSSCVYCPFRADRQWRDLRDADPAGWAKACALDGGLRQQSERFRGELYLHRSMVPLAEVDLSTAEERGQPDMFGNECEGLCGI